MVKKYIHKSITWVDVENPTTAEIRELMSEYGFDPSVARDLQLPTFKEKLVKYKDYLYTVFHFPALRHTHNQKGDQEIDFIVGKNFIITTRYETIDAIEKFAKLFEVNAILEKGIMEDHAGFVLYYIIKELYRSTLDELDTVADTLKDIENKIFSGKEKEMVSAISQISRDLLNVQHAIKPHKEVLEKMADIGAEFFDGQFAENMDKVLNEYYRLEKILEDQIDFQKELRETNNSLLSTKQNEIMKTLTIFAFLAIPFSIITGFFQMNTKNTPLVDNPKAWPIIVGFEICVTIILFIFAKRKRWF